MKLFLYSGGALLDNSILNQEIISNCKSKDIQITYIPASSFGHLGDYRSFIYYFKKLGVKKFIFFPVENKVSPILTEQAFESDVIFLSGGNTFSFLNSLRQQNMITKLKKFVEDGGILAGLSAGAILMTPNIKTASYPDFDRDDNYIGLKKLSALKLVSFEFFPHYKNSKRYDDVLRKKTKEFKHPLYASPDGSGIIVDGKNLRFIGKTYGFLQGKKVRLF